MGVGLVEIGGKAEEVRVPLNDGVLEVVGEGELALDAEDGAEGQVAGDRHREETVERPRRVGGGAGDGEEARGGGGQGQRERERGAEVEHTWEEAEEVERAAAVEAEREAAREVR